MSDATVAFGPYQLDLGRRILCLHGKRVVVGSRALDVLCALAEAGNEPIEKDALLAKIWPGAEVGENNLHVHISALRKLLGEAGRSHLVTVPGLGYRLVNSIVPPVASKTSRQSANPGHHPISLPVGRQRNKEVCRKPHRRSDHPVGSKSLAAGRRRR